MIKDVLGALVLAAVMVCRLDASDTVCPSSSVDPAFPHEGQPITITVTESFPVFQNAGTPEVIGNHIRLTVVEPACSPNCVYGPDFPLPGALCVPRQWRLPLLPVGTYTWRSNTGLTGSFIVSPNIVPLTPPALFLLAAALAIAGLVMVKR